MEDKEVEMILLVGQDVNFANFERVFFHVECLTDYVESQIEIYFRNANTISRP
jgi:hypothetical protein